MSQSSPPRRLIVSLTSYPARIQYVPQVLDTLLAQTRPADEIVLYLSGDQFPGRESDLPEALRTAASGGKLRLRFVPGDLRPHKKYFYAFRDYPDAYIVTVDDDTWIFTVRAWCKSGIYWDVYFDLIENCTLALQANGIDDPEERIAVRIVKDAD